jgi:lipopolysaccharide transport system ATP-binding protein
MVTTISVHGLSKAYRLGAASRRNYSTFRESIAKTCQNSFRALRGCFSNSARAASNAASSQENELWALNNISFDVAAGEVIGLVGGNGAGKSTLLKILSRITAPTAGHVDVRGRMGSLLEVGTGFHQELTGRENIYLNGAILGMPRRTIAQKFDQIVAFAEVERFLDTPVKRYSSGMYTRLAFAVASHLDPDILVVDEVLAVGDAAFQQKCLGRMQEVSRTGRTVLFVSHNMGAIKSLCTRGILLRDGEIALDGNVSDVVNSYLSSATEMSRTGIIPKNASRLGTGEAVLKSVRLSDARGKERSHFFFREPFYVTFTCDLLSDIREGLFEVSVSDAEGVHVLMATSIDGGNAPRHLARGPHVVRARIENNLLPRSYRIDLGIHHFDGTTADFVRGARDLTIGKIAAGADDHFPWDAVRGFVRPASEWQSESVQSDDEMVSMDLEEADVVAAAQVR